MAIIRQPTSGTPTTDTSLQILGDQFNLPIPDYYRMNLYRSDGTFLVDMKSLSGAGGSSGSYRTGIYTDTGLSPGTTYGYYINSQQVAGGEVVRTPASGAYTFTTSGSATEPEPTITVGQVTGLTATNYTSSAIAIGWNAASNAIYYQVQYKLSTSSTWSTWTSSTTSLSATISGLTAVTDYNFRVRGYQGSSYGSYSSTITARTASVVPSTFNWTYTKTSGGTYNLTAQEWNALCSRINQWRQYKGLSSLVFDTALSGDTFYASQFNAARNGIVTMSPSVTVPASRASGDSVTASALNGLRDSINSISQ